MGVIIALAILVVIGLALVIYARIEAFWIERKIKILPLKHGLSEVKILFFSDVHLGFFKKFKRAYKEFKSFDKKDVDIVILGGDLIGRGFLKYYNEQLISDLFSLFAEIPHRYFVMGNHEYNLNQLERERIIKATGFQLLYNNQVEIKKAQTTIVVYGFADMEHGHPDPSKLNLVNADAAVAIIHQPDYFKTLKDLPFDVVLSGHTHGGQFALFRKRLYRARYSRYYASGEYLENSHYLLVSKGLGNHCGNFRFGARPDYYIINFVANKREN